MADLACNNLTVYYDNFKALEHVTFTAETGDYISIVGENGAGKSTLIKALLGLIPIKHGNITLDGCISKSNIGYLPQQTMVQKDFPASVFEVVISGCLNQTGMRPFFTKGEKEKAMANMHKLGICHLKNSTYKELSGGQQQRVLLARALCASSKILILDEPTTGLDPVMTNELYEIINDLNKKEHITILMTSHDINTALKYSNKILHINRGVEFFGSTKDYMKEKCSKKFLGGLL